MTSYLAKLCNFSNNYPVDKLFSQRCGMIYHYTKIKTFETISKEVQLRFVDRFFLNDSSEGIYVLQLCLENADSLYFPHPIIKEEFMKKCKALIASPQYDDFHVYQVSFSTNPDSLIMWNYYGKEGCNLGFSKNDLRKSIKPIVRKGKKAPLLHYGKVLYDPKKQIEIIQKVVQEYFSIDNYFEDMGPIGRPGSKLGEAYLTVNILLEKLMTIGIFMKAPYFKDEKEYRFALEMKIKHIDEKRIEYALIENEIKYMERENMKAPCVDISFSPKTLKSIRVGPTLVFADEKTRILKEAEGVFSSIKPEDIFPSKIPLRF